MNNCIEWISSEGKVDFMKRVFASFLICDIIIFTALTGCKNWIMTFQIFLSLLYLTLSLNENQSFLDGVKSTTAFFTGLKL